MSVKKPEVGDVWEYAGETLHFSEFGKKQGWSDIKEEDCVLACCINSKGYAESSWYKLRILMKTAKYLGKSKACIKDLFQTEQDVSNNVAKPDLQHSQTENDTQTDLRTIGELQAEVNRLKTTLKSLKGLLLDPDCVSDKGDIYVMVRTIDKALNGESEVK